MIRVMKSLSELDTHEFTRRGEHASGVRALADMPRLTSLLMEPKGDLDWQLTGRSDLRADGSREAFLELTIHARVTMRCVRCLESVEVELDEARHYRMVGDEAQAMREDSEDDEHDLLVSSRHFDCAGLIEDEAIMALPTAPRHDDCAAPSVQPEGAGSVQTSPAQVDPEPGAPANPFAALASLRRKPD